MHQLLTKSARRPMSTRFLSSLKTIFNTKDVPFKISFFEKSIQKQNVSSGLFGFDEIKNPEGFGEIQIDCLSNCDKLIQTATDNNETRNKLVARIFDDLSDELCRVADLAEFVRIAHPDPRFRIAAQDASLHISSQVEKCNTNLNLYRSIKHVTDNGDVYNETDTDKHVAKLFLRDFEQSGIHLNEKCREYIVKLNNEILALSQYFTTNVNSEVTVPIKEVPVNFHQYFTKNGTNIIIKTPQIVSEYEGARKIAYEKYYQHDPLKENILKSLLEKRHELANVCSYETFAHRATLDSLAENVSTVNQFLDKLSRDLRPRMLKDYNLMQKMKQQGESFKMLQAWDIPYFKDIAKNTWIKSGKSNLSEYFSLGVCMDGLNMLYSKLFQVALESVETIPGEIWHPNVHKLAVVDLNNNTILGHIYCDFFTRQDKPFQDCHFTIRGGRMTESGNYQNPIVVVMLNLPSPSWSTPTLLNGSMIENLFHEMGHAMHSMLGRTEYQHVTGTRCSTDFAEMPSTLMEYFASDPRVLQSIGRHYKTGEKLSISTLEKYCAARKIFAGVDLQMQTFYSIMDQVYHGKHPLKGSTTDVLQEQHEKHHNLPYNKGIAWQLRFSHLTGYGARYYSYLMARSVATSIWQKYFQEDPFNQENGMKYREECLSHGGGKPSKQLVSDFLGESLVTPDRLADALIADIDSKNKTVYDMIDIR